VPSSISSSKRRACVCVAGVIAGVVLLLGFDEYTVRSFQQDCMRAQEEMLEAQPRVAARREETWDDFNHKMLTRSPRDAVVFVGNSVIQTGIVPLVFKEHANVSEHVEIMVFGVNASSSLTLLETISRSSWRPSVIIYDLAPRTYNKPNMRRVQFMLTGIDPGEGESGKKKNRTQVIEESLQKVLSSLLPSIRQHHRVSEHIRFFLDGCRHGFHAYRGGYIGNLTQLSMSDGSTRIRLINKTPSYDARFRPAAMATTMAKITEHHAKAALDHNRVLALATQLVREGSKVVLVNMPFTPQLRKVDQALNGDLYQKIERQCKATEDLYFIDLGADSVLAKLRFYDGHHREFPVAKEATRRIAELLETQIPLP